MSGLNPIVIPVPKRACQASPICDLEQRKVDIFNSRPGSLPGPECPKCRNKGQVMRLADGYKVVRECECMAARRSVDRMRKSGLGDLLERCTFESYQTAFPWQEKAKQLALSFAKHPTGRWFVASGCSGGGKTHLCTAICKRLMESGMETHYMLWVDESRRLKAFATDDGAYQRMMRRLKTVKVLYIDDLFKPRTEEDKYTGKRFRVTATAADLSLAFEILNNRALRPKLITLISTEISLDDIMKMDSALGSRIYEASRGSYLYLSGDKNWRTMEPELQQTFFELPPDTETPWTTKEEIS